GEDRKYSKQQNLSKQSVVLLHLVHNPLLLRHTDKYAQS
ncbi:MAG: hypothetical protein ACI8PB_005431, partial [Desulforhopalus sp.]